MTKSVEGYRLGLPFHAESKNDASFPLKFSFDLQITMQRDYYPKSRSKLHFGGKLSSLLNLARKVAPRRYLSTLLVKLFLIFGPTRNRRNNKTARADGKLFRRIKWQGIHFHLTYKSSKSVCWLQRSKRLLLIH